MADTATVPLPPTQVTHPARATARTAVQTAIGILLAAGTVIPAAVAIINAEWQAWMPDQVAAVLGVVAAVSIALSSTAAKIMAIPAVNEWLARLRLDAGTDTIDVPVTDVQTAGQHYKDANRDGVPDLAPDPDNPRPGTA